MTTITFRGGDKLKAVLERIKKGLGRAESVSIGFMDGATYPDGTSVAMVAALQNYGTSRIPARPFFSNMVRMKSRDWGKSLGQVLKYQKFDGEKALLAMGQGIGAQLQQAVIDTNTPPLAASTVAQRIGKSKKYNATTTAKPLIRTGHMINSVQYEVAETRHDMPKVPT